MSKSHVTPIRQIRTYSFTPTLNTWIGVFILWTAITSFFTYMVIYKNAGVNQFTCKSASITQPIINVAQEDKHQKVLAEKLVTAYNVKPDKAALIVNTVANYTRTEKFPSTELVLALIATESMFNHKAESNVGAAGLMQVMPLHHAGKDMFSNVQAGVNILREYKNRLGSVEAGIMAYNTGDGAYLSGIRATGYLQKVQTNLRILRS